jgi:hypothetical protein
VPHIATIIARAIFPVVVVVVVACVVVACVCACVCVDPFVVLTRACGMRRVRVCGSPTRATMDGRWMNEWTMDGRG